MKTPLQHSPDPSLDLLLEREVDVPASSVWEAWTTPELIKQWFTPRPWTTVDCEIDLRPGETFRTVMRSPEGEEFPNEGCILEIVEGRKLVWTSAMGPGYRPYVTGTGAGARPFYFTAVITLEPRADGTKYSALVIHGDEESRFRHEEMGFHGGWSSALDQLVNLVKGNGP